MFLLQNKKNTKILFTTMQGACRSLQRHIHEVVSSPVDNDQQIYHAQWRQSTPHPGDDTTQMQADNP